SSTSAAWGPATPVAALNDATTADGTPHLSPDGKTLYFTRATAAGLPDIYVTTRTALDGVWSPPQVALSLPNSTEAGGSVDQSGTHVVFSSNMTGPFQVYESLRPDTTQPWGQPQLILTFPGSDTLNTNNPHLSPDGLTLWLYADPLPTDNKNDLFVTRR